MFKQLLEFIPFLSRDGKKEKIEKATLIKPCFLDLNPVLKKNLWRKIEEHGLGPHKPVNIKNGKYENIVTLIDKQGNLFSVPKKAVLFH